MDGIKMKSIRDSYFVVQGWMAIELGLSGLDLMVYAIIWGYCQNTQSYFYGSRQYIASITGASVRGVQKSLQKLQDKGLIINIGKHSETNTIKYVATKSVNECTECTGTECTGTECTDESALSAQGQGTECTLDREQSAHNNIYNNLDDNLGNNIVSPVGEKPLKNIDAKAMEMAELLFALHQQVDPKARKPNFEKWAADIEKIKRIDGRSYEDIEKVIRWAKKPDNFWFSNIMSGEKLRKQFDRLYADSRKISNKNNSYGSAVTQSGCDEIQCNGAIPF